MFRDYVNLSVNGELHQIRGKSAFFPLSDFLRYELELTGTKVVCAEGDCGACTVMFHRPNSKTSKFASINSCISATLLLDGSHIVSVEGLGTEKQLSEVQDSMVRNFGGQCGFCTPGFVMSIANMYEQKNNPNEKNAKNYLTGNLCRCTGYQPIINAALDIDTSKIQPFNKMYEFDKLSNKLEGDLTIPIKIGWQDKEFFAPTTLQMAVEYKLKHPGVRIFSGATDLGVQINKGKNVGQQLMSLHLLKQLQNIEVSNDWIQVGARVNLSDLQTELKSYAPEFADFLNIFASPQIKNAATLVGNIANGSPIADTTPYLLAADAEVVLFGQAGERHLPLKDFIIGYKQFDIKQDELITHIRFKILPKDSLKIGLYKVSQRRDLDISCVNSVFVFALENKKVKQARIVFGGVGPKTIRLFEIEKTLIGSSINNNFIAKTKDSIAASLAPLSDARGSAEFRRQMCQDLFESFAQEHLNI